jgi:phosphoglycolate phosphatase-like HAD superfamily hydrolase
VAQHLESFVSFLRANSLQVVVFDMDRTLVSQHSGGCVPASSLNSFAASLTPASRALIPFLMSEGLHVAVATFADDLYASYRTDSVAGVSLVRRVLRECSCFQGAEGLRLLEERVAITTLNPDLYDITPRAQRGARAAAAAEEQARMQQGAGASAASAASAAAAASAASSADPAVAKLRTFFHSKLTEFGLDASHASWATVASFPPPPFKNRHLELISAKLGIGMKHMLLLDDRDENGLAALEAGAWALFLRPPKKGLELGDLSADNVRAPKGCNKLIPEEATSSASADAAQVAGTAARGPLA